jgi:hypothetical protein
LASSYKTNNHAGKHRGFSRPGKRLAANFIMIQESSLEIPSGKRDEHPENNRRNVSCSGNS